MMCLLEETQQLTQLLLVEMRLLELRLQKIINMTNDFSNPVTSGNFEISEAIIPRELDNLSTLDHALFLFIDSNGASTEPDFDALTGGDLRFWFTAEIFESDGTTSLQTITSDEQFNFSRSDFSERDYVSSRGHEIGLLLFSTFSNVLSDVTDLPTTEPKVIKTTFNWEITGSANWIISHVQGTPQFSGTFAKTCNRSICFHNN